MGKPDWSAIEADYLATGLKYPSLAKKWGVSLNTLKKKASAGKWAAKLEAVAARTEAPETAPTAPTPIEAPDTVPNVSTELVTSEEFSAELRSRRYRRMIEASDMIMDHIIDALGLIKPDDTMALGTLVRALKDLREMQGLNKSALDIEEQRARIAKLRSDTRIVEDNGEGGIIFMPTMADRPTPPEDNE